MGTGTTTAAVTHPSTGALASGRAEPHAVRVARLEARVAELEADKRRRPLAGARLVTLRMPRRRGCLPSATIGAQPGR